VIKKISDIMVGDVLEDSSIVEATMRIDNKTRPVAMYVINGAGVEGEVADCVGSGSNGLYYGLKQKQSAEPAVHQLGMIARRAAILAACVWSNFSNLNFS
jgi:hypothetical protein